MQRSVVGIWSITEMDNPWYSESDVYCEKCAPLGSKESVDTNETDCPEHCSECHTPLDCSLTPYGVAYVVEALREELRKGREHYLVVYDCYKGTYYEGEPHVSIMWDWAYELQWVKLSDTERRFVDKFVDWTRYQWEKKGEQK